jgi:hypothetical protein
MMVFDEYVEAMPLKERKNLINLYKTRIRTLEASILAQPVEVPSVGLADLEYQQLVPLLGGESEG